MLVPTFWAEGREQRHIGGRQVTVRRFGWSDISQSDAQANANARVVAALVRIEHGETIHRRDLKRGYNGSEGVPIREEVIARQGDTVLTRNTYGSLCLNTPNVLFADIDLPVPWSCFLWFLSLVFGVVCAVAVGIGVDRRFACLGFLAFIPCILLLLALRKLLNWMAGGDERIAIRRIEQFVAHNPDWHVRVYRTPAGLRALVVHQTLSPHDPIVAEFFRDIQADPLYVQMCLKQNCFRARVSPKPWRIGINERIVPRTVWPCTADDLPAREKWIRAYDKVAPDYASCRFVETIGSGVKDSQTSAVQHWHDELCQAAADLPLA